MLNIVHFRRFGSNTCAYVHGWKRAKKVADRLAGAMTAAGVKENIDVHLIRSLPERQGLPKATVLVNTPSGWSLVKWVWKNKGPDNVDYRWCLHQYTP